MTQFIETANMQVNTSFGRVAGIQSFWVEDLIKNAKSLKENAHASVKRAMESLDSLMESDETSVFLSHPASGKVGKDVLKTIENHDVGIVLNKMKEMGIEHLELNPNHDMNTQILVKAVNLGIIKDYLISTRIRDAVRESVKAGETFGTKDPEPESAKPQPAFPEGPAWSRA